MVLRNSSAGNLATIASRPPRKYPLRGEKSHLTLKLTDVVSRYACSKRQKFYYVGPNSDGTRRFGIDERTPVFDIPAEFYEALGNPETGKDIKAAAFVEAYNQFILAKK